MSVSDSSLLVLANPLFCRFVLGQDITPQCCGLKKNNDGPRALCSKQPIIERPRGNCQRSSRRAPLTGLHGETGQPKHGVHSDDEIKGLASDRTSHDPEQTGALEKDPSVRLSGGQSIRMARAVGKDSPGPPLGSLEGGSSKIEELPHVNPTVQEGDRSANRVRAWAIETRIA